MEDASIFSYTKQKGYKLKKEAAQGSKGGGRAFSFAFEAALFHSAEVLSMALVSYGYRRSQEGRKYAEIVM